MRFAGRRGQSHVGGGGCLLNVGFVPSLDAAPFVVAQELGMFARRGLRVRLRRELGWATAREKLFQGDLDAVNGPVGVLLWAYCGWSGTRHACLTGLLLGAQSRSFVLAQALAERVGDSAGELLELVRSGALRRPLHLGVVLESASTNLVLRRWLAESGLRVDRDVRLSCFAPALLGEALAAGHIDGFYAVEPTPAPATLAGHGRILDLARCGAAPVPGDEQLPENALLVLRDFAAHRDEEHLQLVAALLEAGHYCDAPEHRAELAGLLARPAFFDTSEVVLKRALGLVDDGNGAPRQTLSPRSPSRPLGARLLEAAQVARGEATMSVPREVIPRIFRPDIYDRARAAVSACSHGQAAAGSLAPRPDASALGGPSVLAWMGSVPLLAAGVT